MNIVAILLSTYNGEKFLVEQLQSLSDQTYPHWKLYLRDDCSTDKTIEILQVFQKKYPEKVTVCDNGGINLGAKKSFTNLLSIVEEKYYMFCDQDDVWLPTKIEKSLSEIKRAEIKFPNLGILVFCDAIVTDQKLNTISASFWKTTKVDPYVLNQGNKFEVFNCAPGCTMLFNFKLKSKLFPFPEKAPMHDWWITIAAQRNGLVIPMDERLILYRQHGNNTVGAEKVNRKYFLSKFYYISETFKAQQKHLQFLSEIKGMGFLQFYFIKLSYTLRRL